MNVHKPSVTICIPHWQVRTYMTACLRSIRRHSAKYDLQVIVVDNGSRDDSLDYLRSLSWIRLIERPDETHTNWPRNVFTAWDRGLVEATGDFYLTLHSDVFVKADGWLDPLLREIGSSPVVAAAGAWKLETGHPVYLWQKRVFGYAAAKLKTLLGRRKDVSWKQGHYPRDYCAMYRVDLIRKHRLTFCPHGDYRGGGHAIARQLIEAGYAMGMVPAREMAKNVFHVAHGTAAVAAEKPLNHRRAQRTVERKVHDLFEEAWIQSLLRDDSLDGPTCPAREPLAA
jgi:glycosyltransferase involved in cell wall biosynthesis